MSPVELFGWLGTLVGTVLGLPQLFRLARTRSIEGLSLVGWQAMLAVNIGWTVHGISIGQPPQIITSAFSLLATVPILFLMSRELHRRLLPILLPGLLLAAAMIAIDQVLGSAAYGAVAILPAVLANAGQSLQLVRSPHIKGVSVLFLLLAVVNQVFWLTWAYLVPDAGTIIAATTTGTIAAFNLTWYALRRMGLPAYVRSKTDLAPRTSSPEPIAGAE
jgi:uncharacterized protein with PQ loop repeat